LSAFGLVPHLTDTHRDPVGTPEALEKQGLNPRMVGSCSLRAPGNSGCDMAEDCIFGLKENGGFKGKVAPSNVGYFLQVQEGPFKEDFCSCFHYMRHIHSREQQQKKTGEKIYLVAQEGEPITIVVTEPEEPVTCNKTGNTRMKTSAKQIPVPKFPRVDEVDDEMSEHMKVLENRKKLAVARAKFDAGIVTEAEVEQAVAALPRRVKIG
jgi:hypothetical protein